ncbi:hypothetical protein FKM82_004061 [Ascaphus truei]
MKCKQLLLGWRFLSLLRAVAEIEFHPICRLEGQFDLPGIIKKGDVDIGGIFSVHFSFSEPDISFRKVPDTLTCTSFSLGDFQFLQTMIFTIEEINRNNKLLPNVTLGYRIHDTCNAISQSERAAISMTTGTGKRVYNCEQLPLVPVIIGDSMSTQSLAVATLMGVFKIPMISYFSTCPCLSNKHDYPTFLRTLPSDFFQSRALAQLVNHFKWTWIGIIAEDTDYGQNAASIFKDEAKRLGTCVAFTEMIPTIPTPRKISQIVNSISVYKVKVVLLFTSNYLGQIIFQEVVYQNITGIQWIASEAWSTSSLLSNDNFQTYLVGTIGFAIRRADITGLKSFLLKVHQSQHQNNPLLVELWEEIFNCSLGSVENVTNVSKPFCSGLEDLNSRDNIFLDVNNLRISYNVYKGVYAVAHALHNMLALEESNGSFVNGTHINGYNVDPWKLLKYLKCVNFTTSAGDKVNFDQNGDPYPSYDLLNWQKRNDGSVVFVPVGEVNEDGNLRVDEDVIVWQGAQKEVHGNPLLQVPISVCSKDCPPGSRKAVQAGMHPCCFDCISCDNGEISNQTSYRGIVCGICFILAFCAQNLPSRFNEAKLLTFSMAIFSAVWIGFIPAYLSAPGKYMEAVEMFAILSSSFGLLACIFAPKCYIIILKPEKNDKKYMRRK